MNRSKSVKSTLNCMSPFLLVVLLLFAPSQEFNLKTRQTCCGIGTNFSSKVQTTGRNCKDYQPPIPGISTADESYCLSTIDLCCRKQLRVIECESGQEDAKLGTCTREDGEKKDCCEACQMGIETKKSGDPCTDTLGFGSPYAEAYTSCCENPLPKKTSILPTSTTAKPTRKAVSLSTENVRAYPGLSEEHVCETQEFCAQLCEPSGTSFKCGCFPGYQLMKDGVSCKPIKHATGSRCEQHNPCDHDCTDTGTSIVCSCRDGYTLGIDNRTCNDIDECALGTFSCEPGEECENDEGTYFCFVTELESEEDSNTKCPVGHKFNAEKSVCDDVNECEFDLICAPPKTCKNTIGSFICEGPDCPPGFKYKASIETCSDIDECLTEENDCDKVSEICVNTKGNYTCVDKASRTACPPGFKKNNLTFDCEDINECNDDIKVCLDNEECINEEGGYKCVKMEQGSLNNKAYKSPFSEKKVPCPTGFKYNGTKSTCDDINECQLRLDNCSAMHRCDNTIGSFYCTRTVSCGTGYTLNSHNDLCEDDDECALGTHNCNDLGPNYRCKNQMGTYKCDLIRPIYRPPTVPTTPSVSTTKSTTQSSTHTTPIKSSPQSFNYNRGYINPNPYNRYNPTDHSTSPPTTTPYTTPYQGPYANQFWHMFRPNFAPQTTTSTSSAPTFHSSYFPYQYPFSLRPYRPIQTTERTVSEPPIIEVQKKCLPGYKMNDKRDCEDINECESNPCPAGLKCLNFNGRYECSSPLQCRIGYEPNESADDCVDVDECARNTHKCNRSQICKNGEGYYTCECPPGHHLSTQSQMCEDIDECKYYRPCGSNSDCVNTVGSYKCTCKGGFYQNQSSCEDINECEQTPSLCEHNCVNLWGSYRCACKLGYSLRNDTRTCEDIDECEKFRDRKLCVGTCKNIPGSYTCECPKGYKLGSDKRVCTDIDECQQNVCGRQEDICVNTRGGYKCYPINCKPYYSKDPNNASRCKRVTCDPRDNQCLLMPEQYSYQFMTLVSNLPLPEDGISLIKIKGPSWTAARAEFTLKLLEVNSPPGLAKVDDSYIQKIQREGNVMELNLIKRIQGPQEIKVQVEMKLYQNRGGNLIGSIVVYIIIIVSDYTF